MLTHLRRSLRSLLKSPGFTATALATLALCLGANLVIFAVVDAVLLRPLPFPNSDRLAAVLNSYGAERSGASVPNYFERRGALPGLASLSLLQDGSVIVGATGSPNRVETARVTPEFFTTMGVPLARGKMFTEAELAYGTDQVAILTDSFWRTHFHADPEILGKTFLNDGLTVTVIGVLPREFSFLSSRARFFRPFSHGPNDRDATSRHNNNALMIARLAPGATMTEAQAQLDALNATLLPSDPYAAQIKESGFRTTLYSLHADHVREIRPILLLLQCGALFLLVIGAVNLANLILIRASGRTKEIAVRLALGASQTHLAREALTETLLLSLAGGTLGLLLGSFGVEWLTLLGAEQLPLGATIALDSRSLITATGASLLIGVVLALPIIWFNRHIRLANGLQIESRGGTASRSAQRVRHGFIVVQVALAFVLLSGSSLLGLSLKRALETSTGFNPDGLLTGRISLPWKNYQDNAARLAFVERLLPVIRELPGVTHAAISYDPPFTEGGASGSVTVEGYVAKSGDTLSSHHFSSTTSDLWRTLGIPLLRGRFLEEADNHRPQRVCVVDEDFAQRYWPGADPLGRRIALGLELKEDQLTTIVGVVARVKQNTVEEAAGHGAVYLPYQFFTSSNFSLIVRTALPPESLAPTLRKAILQLDPGLPLDEVKTMHSLIDQSLLVRRSPAILAAIFAGTALLLASIGLYGVMAYAVTQRTREFGIRLALGAARRDILRMVLGNGARLTGIGLALGLGGAWMLTGFMSALLYEVKTNDPLTHAVVAILLAAVAALACWLPALRATRVNPIEALRAE